MTLFHLPLAAFVVNVNGEILHWNRACENITGYPGDHVRGQKIERFLELDPDAKAVLLGIGEDGIFSANLNRTDGQRVAVRVMLSAELLETSPTFSLVLIAAALPNASPIADLTIGGVIEELPGVFYVIDESFHLVLWNLQLEEALGMSAEEIRSAEVHHLFDAGERSAIVQKIAEAFEQGHSSVEAELVGSHGKRTPFLFHCARTTRAGRPCIFGTGLDISARKRAERSLQVRERALHASVSAVLITCCVGEKGDNQIEYVNPAFEQITGYTLAEIQGRNPGFMRVEGSDIHEYERLHDAFRHRKGVRCVVRNRKKNGEIFWNDLRVDPVISINGNVTHFVAVIADVTETRHYERRLHHLAHHDSLTGLANRILLLERLKLAIDEAVRNQTLGALAFLDLDNFKHINDKLGHDSGDAVLREIAERLRANVREHDTVARFGGDEFVLLINEQPSHAHVADLLERIRRSVSTPMLINGHEIVPGASIGVSIFPHDGDNVDYVMRAADAAMYHAKSLGKNNVQYYSTELGEAARQHFLLQASLSSAIATNELMLGYQPRICLRSGRIIGAEALVRWHRPDYGMLAPNSFIPVAEETGLIIPLGEWVLNEACSALRALARVGICEFLISVNLSARQLRDSRFIEVLKNILGTYNIDPRNLELEVTESQLMDNPADAKVALGQLKALGVRLSIDDFGTGYSSLSHLRDLPVDYIKIDRSFLINLCQDEHDVIPRAIIALGHNFKLRVVAEGVETQEQLDFLRDHDCDQMQGFFFSPAVPYAQLQNMILNKVVLST